jgi:hypothetical protein
MGCNAIAAAIMYVLRDVLLIGNKYICMPMSILSIVATGAQNVIPLSWM